jgi:hypothetical protein
MNQKLKTLILSVAYSTTCILFSTSCGLKKSSESASSNTEAIAIASNDFAQVASLPVFIFDPKAGLSFKCSAGAAPFGENLRLYTAAHCFYKRKEGQTIWIPKPLSKTVFYKNLTVEQFKETKDLFVKIEIKEGGTYCSADVAYRTLGIEKELFEKAVSVQSQIPNPDGLQGAGLKLSTWMPSGEYVRHTKKEIVKIGVAKEEFPNQEIFKGDGIVLSKGNSGGIVFQEKNNKQSVYGILLGTVPSTPEGNKDWQCDDTKLRVAVGGVWKKLKILRF